MVRESDGILHWDERNFFFFFLVKVMVPEPKNQGFFSESRASLERKEPWISETLP